MRPEDIFDDLDDPEERGTNGELVAGRELLMPTAPVARNPAAMPQWDRRLVVDVCLGTDEDAICETYSITSHQYNLILSDPGFQTAVARMRDELQEEGATFKLKCRLQAEAMLEENWRLAHAESTDPRVKERIIANTVRWAGWDSAGAAGAGTGNGFSIHINLGAARNAQPSGVTYEHSED